jgi:hypothetical protein
MTKLLTLLAVVNLTSADVGLVSIQHEGLACIAMATSIPQLQNLTGRLAHQDDEDDLA